MRGFETCIVDFLCAYQYTFSMCIKRDVAKHFSETEGETVTIRGIAEGLGVSVPTLYRRLKAEGIDIKGLRDSKTGKVTAEGAAIIADMFGSPEDDLTVQGIINGASQSVTVDALQEVTALRISLATAEARLEAATETVTRLDNEVKRLQAEVDKLTGLLEAEARTRQALLTDGSQRRRGLFGWLRGRP